MQPLLILFINLGVGGVQRKIIDICNFLSKDKPDLPIYILLRNKEKFNLVSEIINKKVKIIYYRGRIKIQTSIFFPIFVIWQIFKLKPRAVLAFLDFVSVPVIWAKLLFFWRDTKLVLSEDHYASRVIPYFKLGHLRNLMVKIFYPFADTIFTCSQANKNDLVKNYNIPGEKIRIIKNWTTFTKIPNSQFPIPNSNKKYDLIYIGRFYWTKNLGFLIKGLAKLKKFRKDIRLCLLGSGEEEKNLKQLVKQYQLEENVDFIKPSLDVIDFLKRSKIFVLVSHTRVEGFPVVVLEAMAVGTPVLTRDFSGASEFLRDGENCYLFKTEDEFIKKTVWLLDNEKAREEIAKKAYKYVKKYHSPENIKDYLRELQI